MDPFHDAMTKIEEVDFNHILNETIFDNNMEESKDVIVQEEEILAVLVEDDILMDEIPKAVHVDEKKTVIIEENNVATTKPHVFEGISDVCNKCKFCGKIYKRKCFLERHSKLCG